MDKTLNSLMPTPATALASYAIAPGSARHGSAPHGSDVQGTGLPFAARVRVTHAAVDSDWSLGFDARSSELLGPVPRGAPV